MKQKYLKILCFKFSFITSSTDSFSTVLTFSKTAKTDSIWNILRLGQIIYFLSMIFSDKILNLFIIVFKPE